MTATPASVPHEEVMADLLRKRPSLRPAMVRGALGRATDAEGQLLLRRVVKARAWRRWRPPPA